MPIPPAYEHHGTEVNNSVRDSARSNASEMQKYFGPLRNSEVDTFASDAFSHETHNLPRAYVGRNKFLMATIDFLITKDDDWYTRFVLPWLYTEELHVKWNIWRFNRTMMDYEPEQGVPRYVSYESESRSDSLVRRGLAFIIEHGFYKTELGRQHYLMNLKQIVEAVHETVYFGVMHELMAAPNYYQEWQKRHGSKGSIMSNSAVSALAEERWRFACVQKDIKGLFILDAEIKDRMRRVGIEPTAWIFPSKMAIYASMVPEYFNEFIRAGPSASSALENGPKRFDTFRNCRVFETRPFDTDFMSAGSVEPLMRDREIGEFYVMEPGDTEIRIFDMSKDKFVTVTRDQVEKNAWTGDGNIVEHFPELKGLSDVDLAGVVDNVRRGNYSNFGRGKAGPLIKFILFRPRMTYRMGSAILLKGGEELGQTLHGHHDFQLTDDVIHKTHIGHYTFYSKSVVREPKNMYIAEDVYCAGYIGGENTKFITEANYEETFSGQVNHDTASLIAIAVPDSYEVPAVMSVLGSFEDLGVTFKTDEENFSTSQILREKLTPYVGDQTASSTYGDQDQLSNGVCFQGAQQNAEGQTTQQNTGHWGPSVYDGCASVRQGLYAHLRPPGASGAITYS